MTAAKKSSLIEGHFISTDDPDLMTLGKSLGFEVIERPPELATPEALGEDAYIHGFKEICRRLGKEPDMLVLLFCNAPTVNEKLITLGIQSLINDPEASSAVTVSKYNMYSPVRARKINLQGYLDPYIPFEQHPRESAINCDRDSQGDVWFADVSLVVIRPSNLRDIHSGLLPQRWMGRKILPIYNEAGLDIDYEWQLGQIKWWLKKNWSE